MSQEFYFHGQHFRLKWSGMKYSFECWMIWWCTLWWCRHTVHNKHLKNATFVILSTRQTKNTDARTWAAGYRFYLHTHFVWFYIAHRSIHLYWIAGVQWSQLASYRFRRLLCLSFGFLSFYPFCCTDQFDFWLKSNQLDSAEHHSFLKSMTHTNADTRFCHRLTIFDVSYGKK